MACALLAAACGPRPPDGMRRLDSGNRNWGFGVDPGLRRLYHVEGGELLATKLVITDLDTGKSAKHRFPGRQIRSMRPSPFSDAVLIAATKTEAEDAGESLMRVEPESGRVVLEEDRAQIGEEDLMSFGEPRSKALFDILGSSEALSVAASDVREEDGAVLVRRVGEPRPGVKVASRNSKRSGWRFFPTETKPSHAEFFDGKAYAAYETHGGGGALDEFDVDKGSSRRVASFGGRIESMAESGGRLILLRRGGGPGRRLCLVDPGGQGLALDVPWAEGESEILAVDAPRGRVYVAMDDKDIRTAWSVPLSLESLRAASVYLTAERKSSSRGWLNPEVAILLVLAVGTVVVMVFVAALRQ